MPTKIREYGKTFESTVPVTFPFIRNTESSPYLGSQFQQNIEPAGRYMLHDPEPKRKPPQGWVQGEITFHSPLVIRFVPVGEDIHYGAGSWKDRLYQVFGMKGRALSRKLVQMGFDGIVTVHPGSAGVRADTREIVALSTPSGSRS